MAGRPIPFGHQSSHFTHIQNCLLFVLDDIKTIPDLGAKVLWVSCRLNRTGEQNSPVFVGWVEDVEAARKRVTKGYDYPPVEVRFSDTHPSKLFSDCLKAAVGTVVPRDWRVDRPDGSSQRCGERYYDESHRRSVPIKIDDVYAGTLNVAFSGDPSSKEREIGTTLVNCAQTANSQLVDYIKTKLAFSGPRHP